MPASQREPGAGGLRGEPLHSRRAAAARTPMPHRLQPDATHRLQPDATHRLHPGATHRLQPHATQAATPCHTGCHPMPIPGTLPLRVFTSGHGFFMQHVQDFDGLRGASSAQNLGAGPARPAASVATVRLASPLSFGTKLPITSPWPAADTPYSLPHTRRIAGPLHLPVLGHARLPSWQAAARERGRALDGRPAQLLHRGPVCQASGGAVHGGAARRHRAALP